MRLLVVTVFLLAGGYALWSFSASDVSPTPDTPAEAKTAPLPAPSPAGKTATVEPPTMSPQVIAPVTKPVVVAAQPATTTAASKFDLANPQPQADLNDCIDQSLKLLEAKDFVGLVKTLMPQVLQILIDSGRASSMEDAAQKYSQGPNFEAAMGGLQRALESVKGQTPELNADGTQATFKMDYPSVVPPIRGATPILRFVKRGGYWNFN